MKDLKDQSVGNEYKSKIEIKEADANNLKRFPLFLLLTILIMVITELKYIVIENTFFQE